MAKNNFATIYLVRHGESESNKAFELKNDAQKPSDELAVNLTKRGVEQAKELAEHLKNVVIDAVFSSDLNRARQTAEVIALERKLIVTTTQLIRERVYGPTFDAYGYEKQHQLIKEAQEQMKQLQGKEQLRFRMFADMESREEVVSRTLTFLREIAVAYAGKTVVVVAHGDLMRSLLAHLQYAPLHKLPRDTVKNTGYLKFESDGVDFFLRESRNVVLPKQPTTFYVVRHGETDWNVRARLQGHSDIPINKNGEIQAKDTANKLKHIHFDLAFSSDLLRAKKTTEIIALEHKLVVQATNLLRERHFGELEGRETATLRAYDDLFLSLSLQEKRTHKFVPDMESDEELTSRILTFLRETALAHPGKTILVGTHGGTMRSLLIHLGALTYDHTFHAVKNGAYVHLTCDGVEFSVKELVGIDTLTLLKPTK